MLKDKYSGSEIEEMVECMIVDIEGFIIFMQLYKDYKFLKKVLKRSVFFILEKQVGVEVLYFFVFIYIKCLV